MRRRDSATVRALEEANAAFRSRRARPSSLDSAPLLLFALVAAAVAALLYR
jgi:hypothetical protein